MRFEGARTVPASNHKQLDLVVSSQAFDVKAALLRITFFKYEPPASVAVQDAVIEPFELLGWTSNTVMIGFVVSIIKALHLLPSQAQLLNLQLSSTQLA